MTTEDSEVHREVKLQIESDLSPQVGSGDFASTDF